MGAEVKRKRRRGYTTVSPKHQVTIPSDALAKAGVRVGDELQVEARANGQIVLTRATSVLKRFAGSLPGVWPPNALEELRAEWD